MSPPPPPPVPSEGSLLRGSTSTTVYLMQSGHRRLVPDSATLGWLAAATPIHTLTDAALAIIPEGAPLPSRANGVLMRGSADPLSRPVGVYRMADGLRRLVPDTETLTILNTPPQPVHTVSPEDLAAIPAGANLPSLRDGATYTGSGAVYAYVIQAGLKRPVPDATSLRDLGHAAPPAAIADRDLAGIPDGAAFPSTSRFLHPPDAKTPLVLLPVRLETHFQENELWLRIYPDVVHIDSFDPALTPDESAARAHYLGLAAGTSAAQAAFTTLAQRFGLQRAAWIARAEATPGTQDAPRARAPQTNVLPERWLVIGYVSDGPGEVIATGAPIKDSLPVGPAPDGPGPVTDVGMQWMVDFDRAVTAGMACRIPLRAAHQRGFSRLVVVGLRSQLDPAASAARLGALLRAHHYTDGLQLMPHGAPTNNTEDVQSGLSTRDPGFAAGYAREQGPPVCPSRPTSDGDRLARALGVPPEVFAHVQGADGGQDEQAHAMHTVLWPATWGYYLEQLVAGTVPSPQDLLPQIRAHFIEHVRARGHLPIACIGRQPYGLLAVSSSMQWKPLGGGTLDAPLASFLGRLRTMWRASIQNVKCLAGASDPDAALASFLSMSPSSTNYAARAVIGPQYSTFYWRHVNQSLTETWWQQFTTKTLKGVGEAAPLFANTLAAHMTFDNVAHPLSDVVVAPAPLDGQSAPGYVRALASSGWETLRAFPPPPLPPQPVPLLLLLLRHAALRQYVNTAWDLLEQAGQPADRVEPELVGLTTPPDRTGPWQLLQRPLKGGVAVGTFLDGAHEDPTLGDFAEFWQAFQGLTTLSAEALDQSTREVLDLSTYRLDAWISSLAHRRLDDTRRVTPNGGILLGGYGWLEDVHRPPPPTPAAPGGLVQASAPTGGFVHAPSLAHATTAAVLRSGFLTHKAATRGPFEIDLSSKRVRLGLHLLDGIREGQPLGALLGYRLERLLHESSNGLDHYIQLLRQNFPLGALPVAEGGTAESVDAGNVIDGLALLRVYHTKVPWTDWIPAVIEPQITRLDDALDAVADVTLAESVHQLSRGNSLRAGATLDAIARGDVPPPDLDFVQTPLAGSAVTHRMLAIGGGAAPGWGRTPRSTAEPRLNGWAASLLGDPTRVRARGRFTDSSGSALGTIELGLDRLGLAPLDLLAIPEPRDGSAGELADRLRLAMTAARPPSMPVTATVHLVTERDPAWKVEVVSVSEWAELLRAVAHTITGARALEPRDIAAPGTTPGAMDLAELQSRADASEASLRAASHALMAKTGLDAALLAAAAFGPASAVPAGDSSGWRAQADRVAVELAARLDRLDRLKSGFVRATASPDAQRDQDVARLQAIFGESFVVLPTLAPALATAWPALWSQSAALQAGDPFAAVTWFQRAARVRPGVSRLDRALLYAEALGGQPLTRFEVAQLPATAGERWLGLTLAGGAAAAGRLSLVAHAPVSFTPGAGVAGLVLDEWVDVLPAAQHVSGVSFQYNDPTARAPQAILIAVPPDDFPEWTVEAVEGSVLDALELAKLRAVDPDALETLGHYLPALYFAHNFGQSAVNAVSIDFTVASPPPGLGIA